MIERETGWKRERKIERQSRWEKERATEGKRERKTKVGETEKKKNGRQCGLWERESYR